MEKANAGQDSAILQYQMNNYYFNGDGIDKNIATANSWYKKVCDNGSEKACAALKDQE